MRGKKIDNNFVANFVSSCVKDGVCLPNLISSRAKQEMNEIDEKIKSILNLKERRSKLLDVVLSFEEPKLKDDIKEELEFQFNQLGNKISSKALIDDIANMGKQSVVFSDAEEKPPLFYIIKKLLKLKVLIQAKNNFYRPGINFQLYKEFLDKFFETEVIRGF